jgi:hypothetical protein
MGSEIRGRSGQLESVEGPWPGIAAVPGGQAEVGEDLAMTEGCYMAAMIFKGPPQRGQCSRWISNTRLSSQAQLRRAGAAAGGASAWSAEPVGMILGRSLALDASTPWKRSDATADGESAQRVAA